VPLHHSNNFEYIGRGNSKIHSKCKQCDHTRYIIDNCWKFMGKPPRSPNITYAFTDESPVVPTLPIDLRLQWFSFNKRKVGI